MTGFLIYILTALLWALFAVKMTKNEYGVSANPIAAFVFNFLLCPLAIFCAIVR